MSDSLEDGTIDPSDIPENAQWASQQSPSRGLPPSGNSKPAADDNSYQYAPQSQAAITVLEEAIVDPDVNQVDGYSADKFSVQLNGINRKLEVSFASNDDYTQWLKSKVHEAGDITDWAEIDRNKKGVLRLADGSRGTIFLPPIADGSPTFSFRKHTAASFTAVDFIERGALNKDMMNFLMAAVAAKVNILFVGSQGSGKTTLLRALAENFSQNEKVAVVEQVRELNLPHPLIVQYQYQPTVAELSLSEVLDFNLYNGLSRLIVGEVHLVGLTKMLETMIVTDGSMSTYHAFSTEQAGERMKLALQLENGNVSAETAISYIKQAVELVVVLEKVQGKHRVTQITEIDWRASSGNANLGGSHLFTYDRERQAHVSSGNNPDENGRVMKKAKDIYNVHIDPDWFINPDQVEIMERLKNDSIR